MARTDTYDDTAPPRSGVSLAKGPVAIIGIAALALGILGFVFADRSSPNGAAAAVPLTSRSRRSIGESRWRKRERGYIG